MDAEGPRLLFQINGDSLYCQRRLKIPQFPPVVKSRFRRLKFPQARKEDCRHAPARQARAWMFRGGIGIMSFPSFRSFGSARAGVRSSHILSSWVGERLLDKLRMNGTHRIPLLWMVGERLLDTLGYGLGSDRGELWMVGERLLDTLWSAISTAATSLWMVGERLLDTLENE